LKSLAPSGNCSIHFKRSSARTDANDPLEVLIAANTP
jgi:hypothetical protein